MLNIQCVCYQMCVTPQTRHRGQLIGMHADREEVRSAGQYARTKQRDQSHVVERSTRMQLSVSPSSLVSPAVMLARDVHHTFSRALRSRVLCRGCAGVKEKSAHAKRQRFDQDNHGMDLHMQCTALFFGA